MFYNHVLQGHCYSGGKQRNLPLRTCIIVWQHNGEVSDDAGFAKNRRNVERMFKAKSMYEGLDLKANSSAPTQIRSSTLPSGFIYQADEDSVVREHFILGL